MPFISKTVRDRASLTKFGTHRVLGTTPLASPKILDSSDFWRHLEFCHKWKMSFISKTVRDGAISGKFWTQRVLGTTPVGPLKILDSSNF